MEAPFHVVRRVSAIEGGEYRLRPSLRDPVWTLCERHLAFVAAQPFNFRGDGVSDFSHRTTSAPLELEVQEFRYV